MSKNVKNRKYRYCAFSMSTANLHVSPELVLEFRLSSSEFRVSELQNEFQVSDLNPNLNPNCNSKTNAK